jgi:succinate dehydrogenase / fumarate reductase iron-sulfur subunit
MTAPVSEPVTVTMRIHRYNPEVSDEPEWHSFDVPALPTDRVLNLLHHIKWYVDGTLSFRRSCAHGVCGSDAMRINGVNRLACKVLVKDLLAGRGKPTTVTIEPIKGLPVLKDLIVDMEPFFEAYRAVQPYLITYGNEPSKESIQPDRVPHAPPSTAGLPGGIEPRSAKPGCTSTSGHAAASSQDGRDGDDPG